MAQLDRNSRTQRCPGPSAKRTKPAGRAIALFAVALLSLAAGAAEAEDCSAYPNSLLDDTPTDIPGTRFVNTANWVFGTFEIATS